MTATGRPLRRSGRRVAACAVAVVLFASGCSTTQASLRVTVVRVAAPVRAIEWSTQTRQLVGLTADDRLATIATSGRTRLSAPLPGAGRNLVPGPAGRTVFVPQPAQNRVVELGLRSLRRIGSLHAGPAPSYVAADVGGQLLLGLSEDGTTVTAVDLHDRSASAPVAVRAGPAAELVGAERERRVEYHVLSSNEVTLYRGDTFGAHQAKVRGHFAIAAATGTSDLRQTTRLYVARSGSGQVVALEERRTGEGLQVIGHVDVGAQVRRITVDESRIYVVTDSELVVLRTNTFTGYADGKIPVLARVNYRAPLRSRGLGRAVVSGAAVGGGRVFLSLAGRPFLVRVGIPNV